MADLNPVELQMSAVRTGLAWAQSWTDGHILCKLSEGKMTFMVGDIEGFLAVWSWPAPKVNRTMFFLIPPFVAGTLSSRAAWNVDSIRIMTNQNVVGAILRVGKQDFRLQWKWNAKTFRTPRFFKQMSRVPDMMVRAPYVNLSDIIHLAVANMMNPALVDELPVDNPEGGILIDFMPGQINIDGEQIQQQSQQARYYFSPKKLMRGMEIVRAPHLSFTIEEAQHDRNAILYLSCQREGWEIHCAVQSVGVSHAHNPAMRVRETRPPMEGGSWLQRPR